MGTAFWWGDVRERDHLEDLSLDGRIILKCIFKKRDVEGMNWIAVAQDRDRGEAVLNAEINLRVFIKCGNFLSN